MKLITPPGMLLTVAVMVTIGTCAFLTGYLERSWLLTAAGTIAVVGTYGAAMVRPWSQLVVFTLTLGLFAKLGLSIHQGVTSGYYDLMYHDMGTAVTALLPSIALALLSLTCCLIVYRQFRPPPIVDSGSR